jgi:hypothetical protein
MNRPTRALNALALMLPEAVYDDFSGRMKAYMDEADQRIAELEAENVHLLKTVNLCYRFQSERRERIVKLEAAANRNRARFKMLAEKSPGEVSAHPMHVLDIANAALRDSGTEGNLPAEEDT